MTALTLTIEPDELLGLKALVVLSRTKDQNAGIFTEADATSKARELLHTAIAGKLAEVALPWAPTEEELRNRLIPSSGILVAMRRVLRNEKVRRYTLSALAVAVLVLLWGGYGDHWQWTGFTHNGQLWDWMNLLVLPVTLGTIPLWIEHREYISRTRRIIYVAVLVAWIGFVIAGYLAPLSWTGFRGNTLWNWLELTLLPLAVATFRIWPNLVWGLTRLHKGTIATVSIAWVITVAGGYGAKWGWTGYPGNTLWDWLQLLLAPLLVPTVVVPATVKWVSGDAAARAERERAKTVRPKAAAAAE